MSLWRQLTWGLRVLASRNAADNEVADEVQHYTDEVTTDLIARGMTPDEARRIARIQVGNATVCTGKYTRNRNVAIHAHFCP